MNLIFYGSERHRKGKGLESIRNNMFNDAEVKSGGAAVQFIINF